MRRRLLRVAIAVIAGIGVCCLVGLASVYAASEWMLRRRWQAPLEALPVVDSAADLEEGRRLAVIVGCWAGCHGMRGEGGVEEAEGIFRVTVPPLGAELPKYSDAELARLVRYGVKRDGRTAVGMASGTFHQLGDRDLARIVAHLRRQPPAPPVHRERRVYPLGRLALVLGKWHTSAGEVDRSIPRWGDLPQETPFARGRYLASITCSECHGLDFRGEEYQGAPSLVVSRAYSPEQFRHLLRTGEGLLGRDLGVMSWVSRNAFFEFTDDEIAAIQEFLATGIDGGGETEDVFARGTGSPSLSR